MNNNTNYLRVYDEKLDLLYETSLVSKRHNVKLDKLLSKSKLFLNIGDIACYRIVPELK